MKIVNVHFEVGRGKYAMCNVEFHFDDDATDEDIKNKIDEELRFDYNYEVKKD